MEDHVEEIYMMLCNDLHYIREGCTYIDDEDREVLERKILVALDLLFDCSDLMRKKRKEKRNG